MKVLALCLALSSILTGFSQSPTDTNFCRTYTNFLIFNETQNNVKELDLDEMGLDTLQREGEDDLDYDMRLLSAKISRVVYQGKDVYKTNYSLYDAENANIVHDKEKNFAYYIEEFHLEGFAPNYRAAGDQLIGMLDACASYEPATIIKENFNKNDYISAEYQKLFGSQTVDVYRIGNPDAVLRIVVTTDSSAATGHLHLFFIHKDFVKEIVTK